MKKGSYALDVQTVFPSVTLPCHMSCSTIAKIMGVPVPREWEGKPLV